MGLRSNTWIKHKCLLKTFILFNPCYSQFLTVYIVLGFVQELVRWLFYCSYYKTHICQRRFLWPIHKKQISSEILESIKRKIKCYFHVSIWHVDKMNSFLLSQCCLWLIRCEPGASFVKWQLRKLRHLPWLMKSERREPRWRTTIILMWRWRVRMSLWCTFKIKRHTT